MSIHEELSRLLDGELSEAEAEALHGRIAAEPELAVAWEAMRRLPEALSALPDVPPPPELDREVVGAAPELHRFSRRWAPWAAIAACALLAWMWLRPGPPIVLVQGSQFVQGQALVLAGDTEVEVAGRALIEVEPPGGLLREDMQEATMNKTHLLAALAGAVVTVTVYEGSAAVRAPDAPPVTVVAGDTHSTGPAVDAAPAPVSPAPTRVQVALPDDADAAERERLLAEEIGRLRDQLESARIRGTLTRGQLESHEGVPQPWPEELSEVYRPEAFEAALEAALEEVPFGDLEVLDCSEYPCVAVVRSHKTGDDWRAPLDDITQLLKDAAEGDRTGVIQHLSGVGINGQEHRFAGLSVGPDGMGEDPDLLQRAGFRIESAIEGLLEEGEPDEQDVDVDAEP
jgi:anti-sigma factor RsiW